MRSGDDGSVGYSKLSYMTASSTRWCHFAPELASSGCNSREMYSTVDVVQWVKKEGDVQGKENEARENLKENRRRFNGRERCLLRWVIDGLGRFETLSQGEYKEISAETHQISDQRHSFPLPEVWHAVDAVQSAAHPGDNTRTEQSSTPAIISAIVVRHDKSIRR